MLHAQPLVMALKMKEKVIVLTCAHTLVSQILAIDLNLTVGKLCNLFMPQFPQLYESNKSTYAIVFMTKDHVYKRYIVSPY